MMDDNAMSQDDDDNDHNEAEPNEAWLEQKRSLQNRRQQKHRAQRSVDQLEHDRESAKHSMAEHRARRSADELEDDRETDKKRKAERRAQRSADELEYDRESDKKRKAERRARRSADELEYDRESDKRHKTEHRARRTADELEHDREFAKRGMAEHRARRSADELEADRDAAKRGMAEHRAKVGPIEEFLERSRQTRTSVCVACHQVYYPSGVQKWKPLKERLEARRSEAIDELLAQIVPHALDAASDEDRAICKTCARHVSLGEMPQNAIAVLGALPDVPPELSPLNELEERLVALRIPFMAIKNATGGKHGARKLCGAVVNVPTETDTAQSVLPRTMDESCTLHVHLKRNVSHKHPFAAMVVSPSRIMRALSYLVHNSPLYKDVQIHDDWTALIEDWNRALVRAPDAEDGNEDEDEPSPGDLDDPEARAQLESHGTGGDTMYSEEVDALAIAPGQGSTPLWILKDDNAEAMAFPTVFAGQPAKPGVPYSRLSQSWWRRVDRRMARRPDLLFFVARKLQLLAVESASSVLVRFGKMGQADRQRLTAGTLAEDKSVVSDLVGKDLAYSTLTKLRLSPAYWSEKRDHVLAMCRQLGKPTWFWTVTIGEVDEERMLRMLYELSHGVRFATDADWTHVLQTELSQWADRADLVRNDPVAVADYIAHRIENIVHLLYRCPDIAGDMCEDYRRDEEQTGRRSLHHHGVSWCKGAPVWAADGSNDAAVAAFVDAHVTSDSEVLRRRSRTIEGAADTSDDLMRRAIVHGHRAARCDKRLKPSKPSKKELDEGVRDCSQGYPKPPMPSTAILLPLLRDDDGYSTYRRVWRPVRVALAARPKWDPSDTTTFDEFLATLGISFDAYILAVRTTIKRPTVFLARLPRDININACSPVLFHLLQVNLDMQFLPEALNACYYVTKYITKKEEGTSEFVREMNAAVLDGQGAERQKQLARVVRKVGAAFLNGHEMGQQVAAAIVLRLSFCRSSRGSRRISTALDAERVHVLRGRADLQARDRDDPDVFLHGAIDRYRDSPEIYRACSLADFVCNYDLERGHHAEDNDELHEPPGATADADAEHLPAHLVAADGTRYRRRGRTAIMMARTHGKTAEETARLQLLLYVSGHGTDGSPASLAARGFAPPEATCAETLLQHRDEALAGIARYEHVSAQEWQDAMQSVEAHEADGGDSDDEDDEALREHMRIVDDDTAAVGEHQKGHEHRGIAVEPLRPVQEFYDDMRLLTRMQRAFLYGELARMRRRQWTGDATSTPIVFVSGGAGVGKTFVIKLLREALIRFAYSRRGADPTVLVALTLSTWGTPAFNVEGHTVHSALNFEANNNPMQSQLADSVLQTLRNRYRSLEYLFIEEVSTLGSRFLVAIDQRLRRIKQINRPFGGIAVFCDGDFYQAAPVMDGWPFKPPPGPVAAVSENLWQKHARIFELTEVIRQENAEDARLLNRMRVNQLTAADHARLDRLGVDQRDIGIPWAVCTNEEIKAFNAEVYAQVPAEKRFCYEAIDEVVDSIGAAERCQILHMVQTSKAWANVKKTANLPFRVEVADGMFADFRVTYNSDDGIRNGAYAVIVRCTEHVVFVRFVNQRAGALTRADRTMRDLTESKGLDPDTVTPIMRVVKDFDVCRGRGSHVAQHKVTRRQFPFTAGNARTIDRSLGTTIDGPFGIDLSQMRKRRSSGGLMYVACSRVKRLDDLRIVAPKELHKIRLTPVVVEEMDRLRKDAPLQSVLPDLADLAASLTLVAHNARSLVAHAPDEDAEPHVRAATLALFSETRARPSDPLRLASKPSIWRLDDPTGAHGLAACWDPEIAHVACVAQERCADFELAVLDVRSADTAARVLFGYRAPRPGPAAIAQFDERMHALCQDHLELAEPGTFCVVLGDFNLDVTPPTTMPAPFARLAAAGYEMLIDGPTTTHGALLDVAFVRAPRADPAATRAAGVLETYFSDHLPVYVQLGVRSATSAGLPAPAACQAPANADDARVCAARGGAKPSPTVDELDTRMVHARSGRRARRRLERLDEF